MTSAVAERLWHRADDAALPTTMESVVFSGPGRTDVVTVDVPQPRSGRALIEVAFVGICGTDVHLLAGDSAYVQSGQTDYPIRFGHEYSGTIVAVADPDQMHMVGTRVAGDAISSCGQCHTCKAGRYNLCPTRDEIGVKGDYPGAAARYFSVPLTNVHRVPDAVSLSNAVLAEPSVTVLNALAAGELRIGSRVAVIGSGALGLIAARLAVGAGCHVTVIGVEDAGLRVAKELGADEVSRPENAPSNHADLVLEMSGARSVGALVTTVADTGGRIVQVGIPGGPVDGVRLSDFTAKGLRLSGVLGGVHLIPTALRLIDKGLIRPDELVDRIFPYEQTQEAFERLAEPDRGRPKVLLRFAG